MHDRTLSMPEIAGLSCLIILLLVTPVAAASSWNYTIVSDPELDGIFSALSGDYLVYSGSIGDAFLQNSTRVIQLYSLSTGEQVRIATSSTNSTLTGEDIDGNYAVWFSEPQMDSPAGIPNRIFLYSIPDKNLTFIRTSSGAEWPKISGERVIWSESVNDSFTDSIMLYDIRTGNYVSSPRPRVNDGAGVAFDGNNILYTDAGTLDLFLYNTGTGSTATVFARTTDNNTREIVFGTALGGDYVLYRKDVMVEKPRQRYSELCLYTISHGKNNPVKPHYRECDRNPLGIR